MTDFEALIFDSSTFNAIQLPPKRKILAPWLTEQSITMISGERGTGKTWLALSLLDTISRGNSFGPWSVESSVPVLYLDAELPSVDIQDRLRSLNPEDNRQCPLWVYSDALVVSCGGSRASLPDRDWQSRMKKLLLEKGIKIWVVDNLSALSPRIDENLKKDYDPINEFFLQLRFAGVSTIFLHHTGKKGMQRGTSAHEDVIDASIILKKPSDYTAKHGARFILSFAKSRVCTRVAHLLKDVEFHLRETPEGCVFWEFVDVKAESKEEILQMLNNGVKNRDIANRNQGCS